MQRDIQQIKRCMSETESSDSDVKYRDKRDNKNNSQKDIRDKEEMERYQRQKQ